VETSNTIDEIMDRASRALGRGSYIESAGACREALALARKAGAFERMARICMPLLESVRMIRERALDTGPAQVVTKADQLPETPTIGCYLFAPWLVGMDARLYRAHCASQGVGVVAMAREPTNKDGLWPVVGVGERVVRIRVDPPGDESVVDPEWFARTAEALGDRAIVDARDAFEPGDPPAWYADDLLDRIDAVPEHEKFLMELARACRDAMAMPEPTITRRRPLVTDDRSF